MSATQLSAIERGSRPPPRSQLLTNVLITLGFPGGDIARLLRLAEQERGIAPDDATLPEEAKQLIQDIRDLAPRLSPRFVKALRLTIRDASTQIR